MHQSLLRASVLLIALLLQVCAEAPPLRDQVKLSGTWDHGVVVPVETWDAPGGRWDYDSEEPRIYSRTVDIPASFAGRTIQLEFEAANFVAEILVDERLVATHVGGYLPFVVDISEAVRSRRRFALEVRIWNEDHPSITGADGNRLWPTGGWAESGLIRDVWLRAYGRVAIHDAFIRTSVRNRSVEVDYALTNHDTVPRTVSIAASAERADGGNSEKTLSTPAIILAPGERRTVTVTAPWESPALWRPGSPVLYHLVSRVLSGTEEVDREIRRFGFREIWIEGNQYVLNGVRVNLRGSSTNPHWPMYYDNQDAYTHARWPWFVDHHLALNCNFIRIHSSPAAQYMLDVCDEKGMLVADESSLFGTRTAMTNGNALLDNMRDHCIEPWITGSRNHPCVIIWCAENEGFLWNITNEQMKSLGDRIRSVDATRPVVYDGDVNVDDRTKTYHYPEGYANSPQGSIYGWAPLVSRTQATGVSEYLTCYQADTMTQNVANMWWQGTWCRGLRYTGFADIRPYTLEWTFGLVGTRKRGAGPMPIVQPLAQRNLANGYAPIALFDKAYDDLGIAPLMDKAYPSLEEGANVTRTLVLYNDEFADTQVTVEVEVRSGAAVHARGSAMVTVGLGEHVDLPCTFQVPHAGGQEIELVLATHKGGRRTFSEGKVFRVAGPGLSGATSTQVAFGVASPVH